MSDIQLHDEPDDLAYAAGRAALLVIDMQRDRREPDVIARCVGDAATFAAAVGQSTAIRGTAE